MHKAEKTTARILALLLLLAAVLAGTSAAEGRRTGHEAIAAFRPEAVSGAEDMERILAQSLDAEFELLSPMRVDDDLVLGLVRCPSLSAADLAARLRANGDIVHAEENGSCRPLGYDSRDRYEYDLDDPLSPYQYYLNPPTAVNRNTAVGNTLPQGLPEDEVVSLRACGLWGEDSDDVVVAIIDTGANVDHEDLKDVMWHNPGNIGLPGDSGYNYLEDSPYLKDINGHGSHVAGMIAAVANNGKGIAGVAAGADVRIMVLGTDRTRPDWEPDNKYCFLQSQNYILQAKRAGVNIVAVNNSWTAGPSYLYDVMLEKMGEEGIVNFIAAGNDRKDMEQQASGLSESDVFSTVVVGACDMAGNPAGFSNYGKTSVDVFAPGVNILSTYGGSSYLPNLMDPELLAETTEYYGRFDPGMAYNPGKIHPGDPDTVAPVTGQAGQSPKPFGSLRFFAQGNLPDESGSLQDSGKAYLELALSPKPAFTTGATLEVTIRDPQPGEEYFLWFPYDKNPATTGTDNTLLSILAFRGYREGDSSSVVYGGEILSGTDENGETQCSVVAEGTFQYNNETMDSGVSIHIHQDLACANDGTQLLLSADELEPGQEVGLGFKITSGEDTESLPGSDENAPIHLYIDSLGISYPGMNDRAAPEDSGYELMSGTSMASPAAAASYALLATRHPRKPGQGGEDYVRETLALFLSSATQADVLKDLCSTGGYVDLSRPQKGYPSIADVTGDVEADTLTLYGRNLTDAYSLGVRNLATGAVTDLPGAGMALEYAEDGRMLVIRGARSLFNTSSEFILSGGDDVLARKAYYLVRGQEAPEQVYAEVTEGNDLALLTDSAGETLYAYDLVHGTVSVWNGNSLVPRNNTGIVDAMRAKLLSEGWTEEQLDSLDTDIKAMGKSHFIRTPADMDDRVYEFVWVQDTSDQEDIKTWYYIADLDYTAALPAWEFREAAGYPGPLAIAGNEYEPCSIAAADGSLYLFGAVTDASSPFTYVYCCDLETGEWTRGGDLSGAALSLPYIRTDGGKMWFVFTGEDNDEKLSRSVYCYDGSGWAVLKDIPFAGRHTTQGTPESGHILAACVPSEYGLYMLNCATEGGGSFFVYDPETGECLPLYLTLREGRSDALTASAAFFGGSVYTLLHTQSVSDPPFAVEMYRIPYRHMYRTAPSYAYVAGDPAPVVITAKRTLADHVTYERFRRLTVDGSTVDPKYYRTRPGSLVLTLSLGYLDTLAPGEHPAVLSFTDGTAETVLVITAPVPKTGDGASPALWILCVCLGLAALGFLLRGRPPARH